MNEAINTNDGNRRSIADKAPLRCGSMDDILLPECKGNTSKKNQAGKS
jgi:hypothetical protein